MTGEAESEPIVISIKLDDPAVADRLAGLLSGVPGLRLARASEHGDVALVSLRAVDKTPGPDKTLGLDTTLTPREIQVLGLLAEGASNKSIARHLGISVHTVKFHVASLIDKFEAIGRTDAVAQAVRLGVIQL